MIAEVFSHHPEMTCTYTEKKKRHEFLLANTCPKSTIQAYELFLEMGHIVQQMRQIAQLSLLLTEKLFLTDQTISQHVCHTARI